MTGPDDQDAPASGPDDRGAPAAGRDDRGAPPAGLCNLCRHQQVVRNTRGSVFSLCRRSRSEPERFARYPRLPVVQCPGFEPVGAAKQ